MSFATQGPLESSLRKLDLPMEIELPANGHFFVRHSQEVLDGEYVALPGLGPAEGFLLILGELEVDPSGMETVDGKFGLHLDEDGTAQGRKVIACPEMDSLTDGALCLGGALSFATGVSLQTVVFMGLEDFNRFIPEGTDDIDRLRGFGTGRSALPLVGPGGVEAFDNMVVGADFVGALAKRRIASVYVDALSAAGPALKFRELWRVLEFAFQAHGRDLVHLLAAFPSAKQLGFEHRELEKMRALRGRLGHAASRLGIADVRQANQEATTALGRLWSLVDSVVLLKREASRALDVHELQPLAAFVTEDGVARTTSAVENPDEWLVSWGLQSPRFR